MPSYIGRRFVSTWVHGSHFRYWTVQRQPSQPFKIRQFQHINNSYLTDRSIPTHPCVFYLLIINICSIPNSWCQICRIDRLVCKSRQTNINLWLPLLPYHTIIHHLSLFNRPSTKDFTVTKLLLEIMNTKTKRN